MPDSVTVWENDVPIAPNRFTVEGRDVTVRLSIAADPRTSESEYPYIIRYFSAGDTPTHLTR